MVEKVIIPNDFALQSPFEFVQVGSNTKWYAQLGHHGWDLKDENGSYGGRYSEEYVTARVNMGEWVLVVVKDTEEETYINDWSKEHYDLNYILTEEDRKKGYVRLDAYTVAKVWRIGSKDDSGALWHTFKTFPRYGEKNSKAREIQAMYAQIKALARIEGVELKD